MNTHMNATRTIVSGFTALCMALTSAAPVMAADPSGDLRLGRSGYESSSDASGSSRYASQPGTRAVNLGLGKSLVIDLPRDASEVLVASPTIANAVVRSARKAYLIGMQIGETNVIFFDKNGNQILALDVSVGRDMSALSRTLQNSISKGNIIVKPLGDSIVLSGSAVSAADAQVAVDLAGRIVGDPTKVVNAIAIEGKEQVLLKVSVVEMNRTISKQLGINFSDGQWNIGSTVLNFATGNGLGSVGNLVSAGINRGDFSTTATLRALEENGVMRTLAEPNLTAMSGESAKFLAGGEYPIITGINTDTNTPTVEFKQYGVALDFTPVVLSGGKINLKVATEVSELSNENAVMIGGQQVPGLRVRRAESALEIPSGGSLVLGGLLQQRNSITHNGLPYLKNLPILGQLFRSQAYERNETELVIFVTPYLAKPNAPNKLARPDDGFADATDPEQILLGRFNKIYATQPDVDTTGSVRRNGGGQRYNGSYGFIID